MAFKSGDSTASIVSASTGFCPTRKPSVNGGVSQVWQDVYHCVTQNGKVAYVKVTLRVDGSIVIQFKEK